MPVWMPKTHLFSAPFLRLLAVVTLLWGWSLEASAQRLAYCNTQYVLNKMPEYAQAQKEI